MGITYYKQEDYPKAIAELGLAVKGGTTPEGAVVERLPLSYEDRVMQYYWYFGFALAHARECERAIPIFQELLTGVPDNEIALYNAEQGLSICKEQAAYPPPGAEQTPVGTDVPTSTP